MPLPGKYILPVFFLIIFLGAMILGPLLYFVLGAMWPIPFHRAMDRALLISAVAALGLFWSRIPFAKLWPLNGDAWKQVLLGYAFAAVSVQAMIGLGLAFGCFVSVPYTAHQLETRLGLAMVAALLIPPLEETVFRGFIQGELTRILGWRWAWIATALIYMLAHFVKIPTAVDHGPVQFWSGAIALGEGFQPLANGDFLSGRGLNLFLVGLILGGLFLRSGSLWANAGLHSGWILALLLASSMTQLSPHPTYSFLAGDLLSNPLTSVVLMLLGLWLWRFYRHPSILPETGENAR